MIPVFQEIVAAGSGDCFSACVASLLEIPLDAVPKFARDHGERMMDIPRHWLLDNFNLAIVTIRVPDPKTIESGDEVVLYPSPAGTPCIAVVASPNLPGRDHAVVGVIDESGMDFKMTHDPNKNGKPITTAPKFLYFLVPVNPREALSLRLIVDFTIEELTRETKAVFIYEHRIQSLIMKIIAKEKQVSLNYGK